MYVDAHCHLADSRFDQDRDAVIDRARAAGVTHFIQGGVGPDDWSRQRRLADESWLPTYGLHPWWVAEHDDDACDRALDTLGKWLPEATALGELGLDFYPKLPQSSHDRQRRLFRDQLALAVAQDKPLILHLVRAHHEAPAMLRTNSSGGPWRGLVHAFNASYEVAKQYVDLGLLLGIGGAVTRSAKLRDTLGKLPPDVVAIESDAPDQAPAGFPHRRNEPVAVISIAKTVAEIQGGDAHEVLIHSRDNLVQTFGLSLPIS